MKYLFFSLLFLVHWNTKAQSEVEMAIVLLDNDLIAQYTLDQEEFFDWMGKVKDDLQPIMEGIEGKMNVNISVCMSRDNDGVFVTSTSELDSKIKHDITQIVFGPFAPTVRFVDYSFNLIYTINGGAEEENPEYLPEIEPFSERKTKRFNNLPLKEKAESFENWMAQRVVPMLGDIEMGVEDMFKGVTDFGFMVAMEEYKTDPVAKFSNNCDYWRALMEMEQWNQLILFTKMCGYYATGEYDRGDLIFNIIGLFSAEGSLSDILMEEIAEKRMAINNELIPLVNEGIVFQVPFVAMLQTLFQNGRDHEIKGMKKGD